MNVPTDLIPMKHRTLCPVFQSVKKPKNKRGAIAPHKGFG